MRTRTPSTSTRQKIAASVKKAHAQKTEAEKQRWRAAISAGQKRAWADVAKTEVDDDPEIDYTTAW